MELQTAMYRTSKIPTENTGDYRTIPEGVLSQKVLSFFVDYLCCSIECERVYKQGIF